jgi:hypothetical protein
VKFARQLAAVLLVVAVVAALGVAWERSGEASWLGVPRDGGPAGRGPVISRVAAGPPPGQRIRGGAGVGHVLVPRAGAPPAGFSGLPNVVRTAEIEAGAAAVVIALDAARRRRRRARRRAPTVSKTGR